jgi:hypothetical protein
LRGRVALANARHIYRRFVAIFHGEPFVDLRRRGARLQRPLWASTGTKDPTYSDVLYLEGHDATLAGAARLGLNLFAITEQLQADGIAAFARSYEQLLDALDQKRRAAQRAAT